jgi:acyl-CoA thioester hydrolase
MSDPLPQAPRSTTHVRVRYAETDAAGVVYHANYLVWLEVARIELLRDIGHPVTAVEARGVVLPVVDVRVKYLRPAHLDDLVEVALWVDALGPATFSFKYEISRDGLLLATAWTRHAVCDRTTGRVMRVPGWFRELFAGELAGAAS